MFASQNNLWRIRGCCFVQHIHLLGHTYTAHHCSFSNISRGDRSLRLSLISDKTLNNAGKLAAGGRSTVHPLRCILLVVKFVCALSRIVFGLLKRRRSKLNVFHIQIIDFTVNTGITVFFAIVINLDSSWYAVCYFFLW